MATEETILINVEVNNETARRSLQDVTQALENNKKKRQELRKEISKSKTVSEEQARQLTLLNQQIKQQTTEQAQYAKSVNTTNNSLNAMRRQLEANKRALGDINQGTKAGRKEFIALSKETDALNKKITEQEKAYGVATRQVGFYEKGQSALTTASPAAASALNTVGVAFRFLLSPIGLIVGAIALLLKAFTSTRSGGQELSATIDAAATVLQKFFDVIAPLGKALFDSIILPFRIAFNAGQALWKMLQGDFEGALESVDAIVDNVKDNFNTWTEAIDETAESLDQLDGENLKSIFQQAKALALEWERIRDDQRENTTELEKQRQELENLRVQSRNVALDTEERLQLAQQLEAQERRVAAAYDRQIVLAQQALQNQRERNALADSSTEDLEKEAELERQLNQLIAQKTRKLIEAENAQARLTKQAEAEERKRTESLIKEAQRREQLLLEQNQSLISSYQELELRRKEIAAESAQDLIEIENLRLAAQLQNEQLNEAQRQLLTLESEQRILAIKQDAADKEVEIEETKNDALLSSTQATLGNIAGLFKQDSQAFKAFASAEAAINTYLGATQALSEEGVPTALKYVNAAAIIANGLSQVAKINSVQFADGGLIHGASHSNGGVPFTVQGQAGFEAEGGEFIVNKEATAKNLPLLTAINGGNPTGTAMFRDGGTVSASVTGANEINREVMQSQVVAQEVARSIPSPVVSVKEVVDVASRVQAKEEVSV